MCLEAIWGFKHPDADVRRLRSPTGFRGYDSRDDSAPLLPEGHDPAHHRLHGQLAGGTRTWPDPRNWQGSGNRSVANMFIDLGMASPLSDEQFQEEMLKAA
jgi:hypothetical protein